MAKRVSKLTKVIVWSVIVVFSFSIIFFCNRKVFQVPYTASQKGMEHLEFPLSKVTVPMKKKAILSAFNDKCTWAIADQQQHGLIIRPRDGKVKEYLQYVNEAGQAARIDSLYREWDGQKYGFIWNEEECHFFMPEYQENRVVLVPTWILYSLAIDNAL